jgi:hypothetical protein
VFISATFSKISMLWLSLTAVGTRMSMKKLLIATALAAFSVSAQASTFITYTATGTGIYRTENLLTHSDTDQSVQLTAILTIGLDSIGFCQAVPVNCGISGNSILAQPTTLNWPSITLNFDHVLGTWPTTADGFTGGSVSESQYFNGINSYLTFGNLDTLSVTVFDGDPRSQSTGPILRWTAVTDTAPQPPTDSVPEPAGWAMMISGFALLGGALRRKSVSAVLA